MAGNFMVNPNSPYAQAIAEELMAAGDLGSQEEELRRQLAMSDQLRTKPQAARMDWASQAARGISGIASGYMQGKAAQGGLALGDKYSNIMRRARDRQMIDRGFGGGMWDVADGV